jgi:hypothetical protein
LLASPKRFGAFFFFQTPKILQLEQARKDPKLNFYQRKRKLKKIATFAVPSSEWGCFEKFIAPIFNLNSTS